MPKDLSHTLSQGNYESENASCFDAKNEWGTNSVSVPSLICSSGLGKNGKNANKKRDPRASASRVRVTRAFSSEGNCYLLTLSHPILWAPRGSGVPIAQIIKKIRRRLGPSLAYRWQKARSRHHGEHAHIAIAYPGNRMDLISAIEAAIGVPCDSTLKKNTLAHSGDGIWHLREKVWHEACAYLEAQDEKHGIQSEDHRRRGSSRNAPSTTKDQPIPRQDEVVMQLGGIFFTTPKDASTAYPGLGTAAALKKRWARQPLQKPEGYNRLTYRRPRGRNCEAYFSPAIRNPAALLARILTGVSITSLSLRHRETTNVPIWAAVEQCEEEAANRPVQADFEVWLPMYEKTPKGHLEALSGRAAACLEVDPRSAA
jgi:hypothetical protein